MSAERHEFDSHDDLLRFQFSGMNLLLRTDGLHEIKRESDLSIETRYHPCGGLARDYILHLSGEVDRLTAENERKNAEIAWMQKELADAAHELNIAGPIAQRIRVYKELSQEQVSLRDAEIARLRKIEEGLSVARRTALEQMRESDARVAAERIAALAAQPEKDGGGG